jgi:anaerobic selenocysteine-containing dehydrogenase
MTICTALPEVGWHAGVGQSRGVDAREMVKSDLIVMWGGNPVSTQVNVMTHVSRARKERGAKFVVIDPYRTPTAAVADLHLAPLPGTDGALACAMMHIAFRDGHADLDYLARHTDFPADLRQHLSSRSRHGRPKSPACQSLRSSNSARYMAQQSVAISAPATDLRAAAMVPPTCTQSPACRRSPGHGSTKAAERYGPTAACTIGTKP